MKVTTDTKDILDSSVFGELLRQEIFIEQKKDPKNHYGCYTTFEVRDDFKPVPSKNGTVMSVLIFNAIHGCTPNEFLYDIENNPDTYKCKRDIENTKIYTNGTEYVGWYWDGDGTLAVSDGDKIAVNDDCKKDYEWKWFSK